MVTVASQWTLRFISAMVLAVGHSRYAGHLRRLWVRVKGRTILRNLKPGGKEKANGATKRGNRLYLCEVKVTAVLLGLGNIQKGEGVIRRMQLRQS